MKKKALIVLKNGNTIHMSPKFEPGDTITRVFASRGGRELENEGLTIAYPENVSMEALRTGIMELRKKLDYDMVDPEVNLQMEDDRADFIDYLVSTLIPDLKDSSMEATAKDFETCIKFMS